MVPTSLLMLVRFSLQNKLLDLGLMVQGIYTFYSLIHIAKLSYRELNYAVTKSATNCVILGKVVNLSRPIETGCLTPFLFQHFPP